MTVEAPDMGGAVEKLPSTLEELQAIIDGSPEDRARYLADPEKYENSVYEQQKLTAPGGEPQAPAADGPQSQPETTPDASSQSQAPTPTQDSSTPPPAEKPRTVRITVDGGETIEIDPALLSTYAKGRSVGQGLVEALNGIKEKDTVIDFYKRKDTETSNTVSGLKNRIEQFKRSGTTPDPKPAKQVDQVLSEVQDVDTSILARFMDDPDAILDADSRKQLVQTIAKTAEGLAKVKAAVAATSSQTNEYLGNIKDREAQSIEQAAVEAERNRELREINELIAATPELRMSKDFMAVDQDIQKWIMNIAFLDNGNTEYNENALASLRKYFSGTAEGVALAQKAQANGQLPPPDYDKHSAIMQVRQQRIAAKQAIRNSIAAVSGKSPEQIRDSELPEMPFTYADFFQKERSKNTDFANMLLKARIDGAKSAASAQPSRVATEVPPELTAAPLTLETVDDATLSKLLDKPTKNYSDEEASLVSKFYQANQIPLPPSLSARLQKK